MKNLPRIYRLLSALPVSHQAAIHRALKKMIQGMKEFLTRYPDGLEIRTTLEYEKYSYHVSGVIGELLTELWYLDLNGVTHEAYVELRELARNFSIFVKAVNDLQDSYHDAANEGGVRIPREFFELSGGNPDGLFEETWDEGNRKAFSSFRNYAFRHVDGILRYVRLIPKSEFRCRFFLIVPILIALESVERFHRQNQSLGRAGVKVELDQSRKLYLAFIKAPPLLASNRLLSKHWKRYGVVHA